MVSDGIRAVRVKKSVVSRWLLFTLVAVVFVGCGKASDEGELRRIDVGIATWAGFGVGYVGAERGFFEDLDVRFRVLDDTPARQTAFRSGEINVRVSSVDVFAQERAAGLGGRIILVTDESYGGDGIIASREINSIAGLADRKVAYARGTPSHYLLYRALGSAGLSPEQIVGVPVDDPGHAAQAFLGGSVDAAVTWEPFLSKVQGQETGKVLVTTRELSGAIVDVLVASEELVNNNSILRRFMEGWLKSVDFTRDSTQIASKIIAEGLGVEEAQVQGMIDGMRWGTRQRNRYFVSSSDTTERRRIENLYHDAQHFWRSVGVIDSLAADEGDILSEAAVNILLRSEQ